MIQYGQIAFQTDQKTEDITNLHACSYMYTHTHIQKKYLHVADLEYG